MPFSRRPKLVLASASPQRSNLLASAGYEFQVIPPGPQAEDGISSGETQPDYVARLAYQKAADVASQIAHGESGADLIVACDTVAVCAGHILGKPRDPNDARRMLELLSGREHLVYSGLCLWPLSDEAPRVRVATTKLRMDRLGDEQINEYLASRLWEHKAGAFGYQDRIGWLSIVEGSESNVIGLPMELLAEMLSEM